MARLGMDRTGNKRISTLQYFLQNDHKRNRHLYDINSASECKTYRLGSSMTWGDFVDMPDDLKYIYIKDTRKKFNVPDEDFAKVFKVCLDEFRFWISHLDLSARNDAGADYDRERFISWWNNIER